jgi:hypothetical protein
LDGCHIKNLIKTNSIIFSQQWKKYTRWTHTKISMKLTHMMSAIYIILLNILHQSNYDKYEMLAM